MQGFLPGEKDGLCCWCEERIFAEGLHLIYCLSDLSLFLGGSACCLRYNRTDTTHEIRLRLISRERLIFPFAYITKKRLRQIFPFGVKAQIYALTPKVKFAEGAMK
jgi:hypothetical protein